MAKSIWTIMVVVIGSVILFPAANTQVAAPGNRSVAGNASVAVSEPLGQSILGLLGFVAVVVFMAVLVSGGEW